MVRERHTETRGRERLENITQILAAGALIILAMKRERESGEGKGRGASDEVYEVQSLTQTLLRPGQSVFLGCSDYAEMEVIFRHFDACLSKNHEGSVLGFILDGG